MPPGPRLPATLQTILYSRYRHRLFPLLRRHYGDAFTLRLTMPARRLVVLSDPDDIRTVFAGSGEALHAGEGNAIMGPALGRHSVLLADEDAHRRFRRLLMPVFSAAALRGYEGLVTELARAEAARWPRDRAFRVHPRMRALTLETILRVVFGVTDRDRLAGMRPLVRALADIGPITLLGLPYPALCRVGPWRPYVAAQRRLDELLYAEVADRRRAPDLPERTDVLSRLVRAASAGDDGLTDRELRDQMITLLLAGHETTATALAWTLHELAHDPSPLARAERAADAGDDEYLAAVVKESLRLRPVVHEVARVLTRPMTVAGHPLPAGATVMPAIGLVHGDAGHHPRPGCFHAERFAGAQPAAYTWIPFGGGERRCLGAGFALLEATVVLREVLRRHHPRPAGRRREAQRARNVTLVPARGARLVMSARQAPATARR
nr:cytochrome P450 [Actinomadura graeca]